MAEALFAERARTRGWGINVGSAGIAALVNHGPAEPVISLMLEHGLDLAGHRARQLNVELAAQYDLLLVMENRQIQYIERKWPELRGHVRRLGEFRKEDIPDPYGLPYKYYAPCLHLIEDCIRDWEVNVFGQA